MMQSTIPLKVVSVIDSALDTAAMGDDLLRYAQTRDPSLVKEKPGERLTWFHVRRIPTSLYQRHVMEATSEVQRRIRAFAVGVVRIDNLVTEGGVVERYEPHELVRTSAGDIDCFSDKQLEEIAPVFIEEIGEVAHVRSFLPAKSAVSFPLRDSLASVLEMRLSQDVAAIQVSARESSAKARGARDQTPEDDGAKPGDVPVTGEAIAPSLSSSETTTPTSENSASLSASSPVIASTPVHGEPSTIPSSSMS